MFTIRSWAKSAVLRSLGCAAFAAGSACAVTSEDAVTNVNAAEKALEVNAPSVRYLFVTPDREVGDAIPHWAPIRPKARWIRPMGFATPNDSVDTLRIQLSTPKANPHVVDVSVEVFVQFSQWRFTNPDLRRTRVFAPMFLQQAENQSFLANLRSYAHLELRRTSSSPGVTVSYNPPSDGQPLRLYGMLPGSQMALEAKLESKPAKHFGAHVIITLSPRKGAECQPAPLWELPPQEE